MDIDEAIEYVRTHHHAVLATLKKGKTLQVRVTVIFTPSGTTYHISETTTVNVRLKKAYQSTHHAKGKT